MLGRTTVTTPQTQWHWTENVCLLHATQNLGSLEWFVPCQSPSRIQTDLKPLSSGSSLSEDINMKNWALALKYLIPEGTRVISIHMCLVKSIHKTTSTEWGQRSRIFYFRTEKTWKYQGTELMTLVVPLIHTKCEQVDWRKILKGQSLGWPKNYTTLVSRFSQLWILNLYNQSTLLIIQPNSSPNVYWILFLYNHNKKINESSNIYDRVSLFYQWPQIIMFHK